MTVTRLTSCTWRPVDLSNVRMLDRHQEASVVLHTNDGPAPNGSLFGFYSDRAAAGDPRLAHVQVMANGGAEQYVDGRYQTGHAWDANAFAWGIETEDGGDPTRPWTDAQLDRIVAICTEIGAPGRELQLAGGGGVGWHSKYDAWNQSHHGCPGSVRVDQIRHVVIPRLAGSKPPTGGGGGGMSAADAKQGTLDALALGEDGGNLVGDLLTAQAGFYRDLAAGKVPGKNRPTDDRRREIYDGLVAEYNARKA